MFSLQESVPALELQSLETESLELAGGDGVFKSVQPWLIAQTIASLLSEVILIKTSI
jgi:hypothetical protein